MRFGLRTLLVCVTAVCVILGMGLAKARTYDKKKHQAEQLIASLGGSIQHAGWAPHASPGANWLALQLRFGEPLETRWSVNLAGKTITKAHVEQLAQCEWIRILDLSNTNVGDDSIGNIAKIAKLRELRLANTHVTDLGLANLKVLERLDVLDVTDTAVTYDGLAELEKAFPGANFREQLALSRLSKSQQVDSNSRYAGNSIELDVFPPPQVPKASVIHLDHGNKFLISLQDVEDLRHLTSATSIRVQGRTFPKGGLSFFSDLRNLQTVSIYDTKIETVANDDLLTLARLPRLTRLELYGNRLTNDGIANLSAAHQIVFLSISGANLTPEMLVHLRDLHGLRHLELSLWQRTDLGPRNDRPADEVVAAARENMKHLAAIPNLEELSVMGNLMVDDVVMTFAELKNLKSLILDGRYSSQEVATSIQHRLPGCRIQRAYLK